MIKNGKQTAIYHNDKIIFVLRWQIISVEIIYVIDSRIDQLDEVHKIIQININNEI